MGIPARRSRWWALGVVALLGLSAAPASATSMVQLTTNQLIDASESIVRGTVVEVWTELDEQGAVWTRAQVDVTEVLKGDAGQSAVIVDQRVQWELKQTPVDAVGLMQAAESASIGHGGKIYDALRQPFEKLMLMSALNGR